MKRTTVMLPAALHSRAVRHARSLGISLGELVRDSLETRLQGALRVAEEADAFWADADVFSGRGARDTARNHDRYLFHEKAFLRQGPSRGSRFASPAYVVALGASPDRPRHRPRR